MKAFSPAPTSRVCAFLFSSRGCRALVVALLGVTTAVAQVTWTGIGGDGILSTQTNWSAAFSPSSVTDVVFDVPNTNVAQTINVGGSFVIRDLTFSGAARPAYTFAGTGAPTITLYGNVTANSSSASNADVTFGNTLNLALSAGAHTATVNNAVTLTVGGVIKDSDGLSSLVKTGGGTLALGGVNTFTGSTTINGGYLSISDDRGLGSVPVSATAGSLTLNGGALAVSANVTLNPNRGITIGANGGSFNVGTGLSLGYGGILAGSGALALQDGGALTLTGANTYSGMLTNFGSILQIGNGGTSGSLVGNIVNGGALIFNTGFPLDASSIYAGQISGSGSLEKKGAGSTSFTGTVTPGGGTTVSAGFLNIGFGGTTGSLTGNVVLSGTGQLQFIRSDAYAFNGNITGTGNLATYGGALTLGGANTFGGNTFVAGSLTGSTSSLTDSVAGAYSPNSTLRIQTGAIVNVTQNETVAGLNNYGATIDNNGSVVLAATKTLTINNGATNTFGGVISGSGSLAKSNPGTLNLTGANTYTGSTTVNDGTLALTGGSLAAATVLNLAPNAGTTANFNLGGSQSQTIAALNFSGSSSTSLSALSIGTGSTLTLGGNVAYSSANNPNAALISGGTLALGGATRTFNIADSTNTTAELTVASVIDGGSFGLAKSGAGALVLTSTNTYSGGTTLSAGTLRVTNAGALGTGALTLAGGTLQFASDAGTTFSGANTTVSGATTLSSDRASTGAGLTHMLGTLSINGSTLSIQRGSLATSGIGGFIFGATTLTGNATFNVSSNAALNLGAVGDGGSGFGFTKSGSGTLALGTANTWSGNVTVSGGALTLSGTATLGNGTGGLTVSGGTLDLGGLSRNSGAVTTITGTITNGTLTGASYNGQGGTISANLAGSGAFSKSTSGTVTLSGDNSAYSGALTSSTGTISLGSGNARGTGAWTFNNSSALTLTTAGALGGNTSIGTVFNSNAQLNVQASGAITGGTQTFTSSSDLNASRLNAITGGVQNFSGTSTLTASGTVGTGGGVVTGGTQTFNGTSVFNANVTNAIVGDSTVDSTVLQNFNDSSKLVVAATAAITGGRQTFTSSADTPAELDANHSQAILGGTQIFNGTTSLQVGVSGANFSTGVINGGHQIFNDTSFLKAHTNTSYAISAGTQDFYNGAALVASGPSMITGGTQNFHGAVSDNASQPQFGGLAGTSADFVLINDTDIGNFLKTTPRLTINGSGTVSGGTQNFSGNASLQANVGGGLEDGTQNFSDFAHLRASKEDSVVGGIQNFSGNSFLWASTGYAVDGGQQSFSGNAGAYANATNSISGVVLNLSGNAFVSIGADNALNPSTEIYFSGANGGTGGTLTLNGHSVAVGEISSGHTTNTTPGIIQNNGEGAVTLTIGNSEENTAGLLNEGPPTFSGQIKDGTAGAAPAGSLSLSLIGGSSLALSGTNTYTGKTMIDASTLTIATPSALSPSTAVEFNGDYGTLQLTNVGTTTVGPTLNYSVASIGGTDRNAQINIPSATSLTTTGNADATFAGMIVGAPDSSLIKDGTGKLTLTGANSMPGTLVVQGGTLGIGAANALAASTDVTLKNNATFAVDSSLTIRALASTSSTSTVTLANGQTLSVNLPSATSSSFAGTFSGTGTLDKNGPGTLTLTGTSPLFTGITTISAGILELANANALANSTVEIDADSGGTLSFGSLSSAVFGGLEGDRNLALASPFTLTVGSNGANTSYTGILSGNGALIKEGNGTTALTRDNTFSGSVTINHGTLQLGVGGLSGGLTANITVNGDGTLASNRADNTTYAGVLSGNGTIRQQGTGTLTLSAANPTFTGMAHVDAGTVLLLGSLSASSSSFVHSGGKLIGTGTLGQLDVTGGTFSPGNPVGTMNAGATTFGADGHYAWDLTNASGTAGTGWDLLSLTSPLTISASAAHPFVFDLGTFSGGTAGLAANFNPTLTYNFAVVNTTSIIGFNPAVFQINTSGFQNSLNGGQFSLSSTGTQLMLNFTPVPEPSTWVLMLSGLGALALGARRRFRRR